MEIDKLHSELTYYDLQSKEFDKKNREIERIKEELQNKINREKELEEKIEKLENDILNHKSSDHKKFKIIKQEKPTIFVKKTLVKNQYTLSSESFKSFKSATKRQES